jgi:twinkle protein
MADIIEIKRLLTASTLAVAEMLLPGGRRDGAEWRAGSTSGDKGQSLGVHLEGLKAGIWADFQTGEKGDLLDLWRVTRGVTLAEAIEQAAAWLGLSRPTPHRDPSPSYIRPPKPMCTEPRDRVKDYLVVDRNIPEAVLTRYKVAARGNEIIFPFLLPDGTLALAKARAAEDGAKPVPTAANCEAICFGWQAVDADARIIVLSEGEIDALSWSAFGHTAMSVPFGGGGGQKQKWIENDFDRFQRFERIYLSMDMDEVGEAAAEEIAGRLGRHRCYRVRLPYKDANECLVRGVSKADMDRAIAEAENLDPEGLRRPSDFGDRIEKLFWPEPGERVGYGVPYGKLLGKMWFRPGDLTLWTGASGAGKSQVLLDCVAYWIMENARICLASFEMPPAQSLRRLVKQAGNVDRPTREYLAATLAYLDQGLLVYEKVGKSGIGPLLEIFDYARAKYGCDMFVIDSLLRLGIASDDYAGQEKAVFQMVDWTVKHNVHTHLVAHARKSEKGAGGPPETEDVKGASEIGANAANILTFWRNRGHEEKVQNAKTDEERAVLNEMPGVVMNIAKQRHGDFEGKIGLWFDQNTYRYHSSYDRGLWGRRYFDFRRPDHQLTDPEAFIQ